MVGDDFYHLVDVDPDDVFGDLPRFELLTTPSGRTRLARPDGVMDDGTWVLVKNLPRLRLTYQLRMLALLAASRHVRLDVHVPRGCEMSPTLADFVTTSGGTVRIVEADR